MDVQHSDYIVYADESGDHSLVTINPRFPVFVLSLCLFEKRTYANVVTPAIRILKFNTFGHDMVVFHEQEIRKRTGPFYFLSKEPRERFMNELTEIIAQTDFSLIPIVIDKRILQEPKNEISNIYHLAMRLGLEQLYYALQNLNQADRVTYVIFEARGRKEDAELELEFRRICDGNNSLGAPLPFRVLIADKKTNSEGLQVADMVARPVGLSVLRPEQPNKAAKILERKFHQIHGRAEPVREPYVYPHKAKGPKEVLEAQAPVG